LPSTVEKLSTTRAKLTIEIPFADLKPAIAKAYRDLASQITIPGFRKGHIPAGMIDARLGKGAALSEAVNAMLPDAYAQALESHQLQPLGQPEIEMTKLEEDQSVEFVATVDVVPEFDMPKLGSLAATVEAIEDLDAEVDDKIKILRNRFAQAADVDREARDGDQVRIDLVGSMNGEVLPDAQADGLTYVIGSGEMLDGLDEAVIGAKAGEERTFSSTLLGGSQEGNVADITVTVTQVQERTLPEVDDEFAQLVSQFDTVEEMRQDLMVAVQRMAILDQLSLARRQVMDQLLENTSIDLPEGVVNDETQARTSQISEQLKEAGMTLEDYLGRMNDPEAATVEEFTARTRTNVERGIRSEILLNRIADEEKVQVTREDLTNFVLQKAQENGTTPDQEIQHMQSHGHMGEWMAQIRQSKALDAVVSKATVKDSNGRVIDMAAILAPAQESAEDIETSD